MQYDINADYTVGGAYELAGLGGASMDATRGPLSGTVQGDFSSNLLNVFNLTVIRRF